MKAWPHEQKLKIEEEEKKKMEKRKRTRKKKTTKKKKKKRRTCVPIKLPNILKGCNVIAGYIPFNIVLFKEKCRMLFSMPM